MTGVPGGCLSTINHEMADYAVAAEASPSPGPLPLKKPACWPYSLRVLVGRDSPLSALQPLDAHVAEGDSSAVRLEAGEGRRVRTA